MGCVYFDMQYIMSNIYGFYKQKQKHQSTWVTESKNKSFYSQGRKGIKSGLAGKLFQNIKSITLYIQPSLNVRTDLLLYIQQHRIYCHELLWDFNRFLAPSSVKKMNVLQDHEREIIKRKVTHLCPSLHSSLVSPLNSLIATERARE